MNIAAPTHFSEENPPTGRLPLTRRDSSRNPIPAAGRHGSCPENSSQIELKQRFERLRPTWICTGRKLQRSVFLSVTTWPLSLLGRTGLRYLATSRKSWVALINLHYGWARSYSQIRRNPPLLGGWRGVRHHSNTRSRLLGGVLVLDRKGLRMTVPDHNPRTKDSESEIRGRFAPNLGCGGQV